MAEAPKLKDYFTRESITETGERIRRVHPPFEVDRFVGEALAEGWDQLTFTERSRRIGDAFWTVLDLAVEPGLDVIIGVLPEELDDPEGVLNDGFWMWPFGDVIATYAIDNLEPALRACEELTKRFTAEFAIRPFLDRYPEVLDRVDQWATDPNEHVRRLASEGTRPRLPWAKRIDLPLDRVLAVLGALRRDESLYVRRSVANHLNDLAKDHGDHIISLLEEWHAEGVTETTWIVRHAMRNHLKNGDPRVLALFDYQPAVVEVGGLAVEPASVAVGDAVVITFDLTDRAGAPQKLLVDLVIGYMKANGKPSPKVFKFKDFELGSGATEPCRRKLEMANRSTRKLHPGSHTVTVRVNGADLATAGFELTP